MEFSKKIKQLRSQQNITQEELAEKLFVSRVTVSKWESGRGYPNIDSLKLMAKIFYTSIDDLLSGDELVMLAEHQQETAVQRMQSLLFGIADVLTLLSLLIPLYTNYYATHIDAVILSKLANDSYIIAVHYITVIFTIIFGIVELVLQNCQNKTWLRIKTPFSLCITIGAIILAIITRQLYASLLYLSFLLLKGFFCIKSR
jgi:transcriptional regulator with XRE-family HTH domain